MLRPAPLQHHLQTLRSSTPPSLFHSTGQLQLRSIPITSRCRSVFPTTRLLLAGQDHLLIFGRRTVRVFGENLKISSLASDLLPLALRGKRSGVEFSREVLPITSQRPRNSRPQHSDVSLYHLYCLSEMDGYGQASGPPGQPNSLLALVEGFIGETCLSPTHNLQKQ